MLTNSLAATDVAPVRAGYAKVPEELLEGGVMIYELKPSIGVAGPDRMPIGTTTLGARRQRQPGEFGREPACEDLCRGPRTHLRGSFNLDPRSSRLNTEMGVVIDSPVLAGQLHQMFEPAPMPTMYN